MIPENTARQAIALAGLGTSVAGIARRLGHDRKTIRTYLNGHRAPGQPRTRTDSCAPFASYILRRAADDRHLRGTGLLPRIPAAPLQHLLSDHANRGCSVLRGLG